MEEIIHQGIRSKHGLSCPFQNKSYNNICLWSPTADPAPSLQVTVPWSSAVVNECSVEAAVLWRCICIVGNISTGLLFMPQHGMVGCGEASVSVSVTGCRITRLRSFTHILIAHAQLCLQSLVFTSLLLQHYLMRMSSYLHLKHQSWFVRYVKLLANKYFNARHVEVWGCTSGALASAMLGFLVKQLLFQLFPQGLGYHDRRFTA